jgi:hypothetical protein
LENRSPKGIIRNLAPSYKSYYQIPQVNLGQADKLESYVMQIPQVQSTAFTIIQYLSQLLYSFPTARGLYNAMTKVYKQAPTDVVGRKIETILKKEDDTSRQRLLDVYRFFIKGSSAGVLLDEASQYASSSRDFPYSIRSDFDCQLLVVPFLNEDSANIVRVKLTEKIILNLTYVLRQLVHKENLERSFEIIRDELEEHLGILPVNDKKIKVFFSQVNDDSTDLKGILNDVNAMAIPDSCPFGLTIYENYGYSGPTGFVPLNMTLIKLYIPIQGQTRGIDLIDISIPNNNDPSKGKHWKLSNGLVRTNYGYVQGPVGHYVDQMLMNRKMANTGRENENKVTRRRKRIAKIKSNMYNRYKATLKRNANYIASSAAYLGPNGPEILNIIETLEA